MIRVLIVDDSEVIRKQLGSFLRNADRSFVICGEAADGLDAVAKARELKPDAVVLDLVLPGCDGFAAARQIRELPHKVAMFMYTMHDYPRLEAEAQAAGILRVISKPSAFPLIALLREIEQIKASKDKPETPEI